MGCCAAGLAVALVVARPLTARVLAEGALFAVGFPLGYATVGLVLTLRRPAQPDRLAVRRLGAHLEPDHPARALARPAGPRPAPLPLAAKLSAMAEVTIWAPAIALGVTLPALLVPDGRLRSRRWRVVVATAVAGPALFLWARS